MCNCVILDVTVKKILITAFLKKLPVLAKGLALAHTKYSERNGAIQYNLQDETTINQIHREVYFILIFM